MDINNNEDKELLNQLILSILDDVNISQTRWEGREDIMTVNNKPIGGTISNKSLEIDRWWGSLKKELADIISDGMLEE